MSYDFSKPKQIGNQNRVTFDFTNPKGFIGEFEEEKTNRFVKQTNADKNITELEKELLTNSLDVPSNNTVSPLAQALRKTNLLTDSVVKGATFGLSDVGQGLIDKGLEKVLSEETYNKMLTNREKYSPQAETGFEKGLEIGGELAGGLLTGGTVVKGLAPLAKQAGKAVADAIPAVVKTGTKKGLGIGGATLGYGAGKVFTSDEAKEAWEYGKGMKQYTEGFQQKIEDVNAGDELIAKGLEQMEKHSDIMEKGHQFEGGGILGYGGETFKAITDPAFWKVDITSQLPLNLPLMAEGVAGGFASNVLRVLGASRANPNLIKAGNVLQAGTVFDVSKKEAKMEAAGVYGERYTELIEAGASKEEAHRQSLEAANKNYNANMAILLSTNTLEQVSMFGRPTKLVKNTAETVGKKAAKETGRLLATGLGEGIQEGAQYAAEQWALDDEIDFSSPEAVQSFVSGFGMGGGMHVGGRALGLVTDSMKPTAETADEAQVIALQEIIKDVSEHIAQNASPEMQTQLAQAIENYVDNGITEDEATVKALDDFSETPEGQELIEQATQEVAEKIQAEDRQQMEFAPNIYHTKTGETFKLVNNSNPEFTIVEDFQGKRHIFPAEELTDVPIEATQEETAIQGQHDEKQTEAVEQELEQTEQVTEDMVVENITDEGIIEELIPIAQKIVDDTDTALTTQPQAKQDNAGEAIEPIDVQNIPEVKTDSLEGKTEPSKTDTKNENEKLAQEFGQELINRMKNNGAEFKDEVKELAMYAQTGRDLIQAIEDKDFSTLQDRLHNGNPSSLKLFTKVTGKPTNNRKAITEGIRSLDPEAYDQWAEEQKQIAEKKEKERKAQEKAEKEAAKKEASGKVANTTYILEGKKETLDELIRRLYSDGYRLISTNDYGGVSWRNEKDGTDYDNLYKMFSKEERKYLREVYKELKEKEISEEANKEQAAYDALSQEDKESLEGLFHKKTQTDKPAKDIAIATDIKVGDTIYSKSTGKPYKVLNIINNNTLRVENEKGNIAPIKIDEVTTEKIAEPKEEVKIKPEDMVTTKEEKTKSEVGEEDARPEGQILEPGNEERAAGGHLHSGTDGDSIPSTRREGSLISSEDGKPGISDTTVQQSEDSDTGTRPNIPQTDKGEHGNQGRERKTDGTDDSSKGKPERDGEDFNRDTTGSDAVRGESIENTTKKKTEDASKVGYGNYRINEENPIFLKGGKKTRYRANIAALKVLDRIMTEKREATIEEQRALALYSGWGALPEVFDYEYTRSREKVPKYKDWENEFKEVEDIINKLQDEHFKGEFYNYRGGLYNNVRASISNAHYTSPEVIASMYEALQQMGFKNGTVLEPSMGVGHFFGMLPNNLIGKTKLYGVELDPLTGKIAQALYPNADIRIQGFQETNFPDNLFDVAIGNVPFGDFGVNDKSMPTFINAKVHNYFFAKSIDKVKPGGIIAYITSTGTMDAAGNEKVRNYLAQKANLIGAIRLPGDAFKDVAGTQVTTDIIFLQKLKPGETPSGHHWSKSVEYELEGNTYSLNEYFKEHPDMILGELVADKLHNTRLGVQSTHDDFTSALSKVIRENLPTNIFDIRTTKQEIVAEQENVEMRAELLEGSIVEKDGKLYRKVNGEAVQITKNVAQIKHLVELRDLSKEVLAMQRNINISETDMEAKRKELKEKYDSYIKKHGNLLKKEIRGGKVFGRSHVEKVLGYSREITRKNNKGKEEKKSIFTIEPETYLLNSLEIEDVIADENGNIQQVFSPSLILTQRTYKVAQPVDKVKTADEGLIASINELGYVDMERISEIYGKPEDVIVAELGNKVFYNPLTGWETADEYLSGNVKKKLAEVQGRIEFEPQYQKNIDALLPIIPADKTLDEIAVNLGDSWVPFNITEKVVKNILGFSDYHSSNVINLRFNPNDNTWNLSKGTGYRNTAEMSTITAGIPKDPLAIVKIALNNSDTIIKATDSNGKTIVNQEATNALKFKVKEIRDSLKDYLATDIEAADEVVQVFNDKFNAIVPRSFTEIANNFEFINMNPEISLRQAQKEGIARALFGGNTLLAHGVGVGKTYELIAIAMESKRLGLSTKPLLVVPNTKLTDFENDTKKLYPGAKVLALSEEDFEGSSIKRTLALAAMNEWDMVIVRHSSFSKIPISPDTEIPALLEEVQDLEISLAELEQDNRFTRKQMESRLEKLRLKLENYKENKVKYEGLIYFEDMGFDMILVDEAHEYKNYPLGGRSTSIKGLSGGEANKARDMMIKASYIRKLNGGKHGVVFATGTPLSNSMAEIYVMFKYLRQDILQEAGINNFDAWADAFTDIREVAEVSAKGNLRNKMQFKAFVNLPELMTMFKEFTDIKLTNSLNLPLPEYEIIKVECPPHPMLEQIMDGVNKGWDAAIKERTLFRLINIISNAPQDVRLVVKGASEHKGSKVNKIVNNVLENYEKTKKEKGTQLIFATTGESSLTGFSLWNELYDKLVAAGIPKDEIAFIKTGTSHDALDEIYRKLNAGKIRVAIGSYAKMGVGINVQERLYAIHELNAPYRPADIEQAEGRMIRQGNTYYDAKEKVKIYRYVTVGKDGAFSGDAWRWQILEGKVRSINAVMKGDPNVRTLEAFDEDAQDAATMKAIALGDERWMQKIELEREISQLRSASNAYKAGQARARRGRDLTEKQLYRNKSNIKTIQGAIEFLENRKATQEEIRQQKLKERDIEIAEKPDREKHLVEEIPKTDFDAQRIQIGENTYVLTEKNSKKAADNALKEIIAKYEETPKRNVYLTEVGKIYGLKLMYSQEYNQAHNFYKQTLKLCKSYDTIVEIKDNLVRLNKKEPDISLSNENRSMLAETMKAIDKFEDTIAKMEKENENFSKEIIKFDEIIKQPFAKETELQEKRKELKELDIALGVDTLEVASPDGEKITDYEPLESAPAADQTEVKLKAQKQREGKEKSNVNTNEFWRESNILSGQTERVNEQGLADEEAKRHIRILQKEHGGVIAGFTTRSFKYEAGVLESSKYQVILSMCDILGVTPVPFSYRKQNRVSSIEAMITKEAFYFNVDGTMSPEAIAWHEYGHSLEGTIMYEELHKLVKEKLLSVKDLQEYYRKEYGGFYSRQDEIIKEFIADLFAQAFSKGETFFNRAELERFLNGYIEEVLSKLKEVSEGKASKVTEPRFKAKKVNESKFSLQSEDVQERMEAACGIPETTMREKLTVILDEIKRKSTREFEWMPRTARFSEMRQALLNFQSQKGVAADRTLKIIDSLTKDFSEYDYSLFTYKVIFDDLASEAAEGHLLPFGLTAETLEVEKAAVDEEVENNAKVKEAVKKRKQIWDAIKQEYIDACDDIGFNVKDKLRKENYFRHQVLEHSNAKGVTGTGKKIKTPTNRGFLKKREGSTFDINTDYIQAEFEVMAQMMYDAEVAGVIKVVKTNYDIATELKAEAVRRNNKGMLEYFEEVIKDNEMEDAKPEDLYRKLLNSKQGRAIANLEALAARGELPVDDEGRFKNLIQQMANAHYTKTVKDDIGLEVSFDLDTTEDKYQKDFFAYLNWLVRNEEESQAKISALTVFKGITEKKRQIRNTLGKDFVTWEDLIPEGFSIWQAREGNMLFMANSIPEHIATKLYEDMLSEIGITGDLLRQVLVMGQKFPEMVIPDEVAATLDSFQKEVKEAAVARAYHTGIRTWKQVQLIHPKRWFKYNTRNFTGDFDAIFAGNPSALKAKHLKKAWEDLSNAFFNKQTSMFSPELYEWFKRGGFESLFQAQEISEVNRNRQFKHLMETKMKRTPIETLVNAPKDAWLKYWDFARTTTDFREAFLRYACFLEYLEQVKNNPEGKPENFGASNRGEIMALSDPIDRAYKLTNQLVGAYDEVSVTGQFLSENLIPFWRWNEVNFVRYLRLFNNAYQDGKTLELIGRTAATVPIKSARMAISVGKFVLRAVAVSSVLAAWNALFFADDRDDLPEHVRERAHIIFGRTKNGELMYFSRLGALDDFLEWFGLAGSRLHVENLMSGRSTLAEVAGEMLESPFEKFLGGLGPQITIPAGLAFGKDMFPDPFNPKTIQDKTEFLFDTLVLRDEYREISGKPTRGYASTLSNMLIYKTEVGQTAYHELRDDKNRFREKLGKSNSKGEWERDAKGEALYNYKLALRYGDEKAMKKYLTEYIMLGGTSKGLKQSLDMLHPLYGLSEEERVLFLSQLDERGRTNFIKAMDYYNEVILP